MAKNSIKKKAIDNDSTDTYVHLGLGPLYVNMNSNRSHMAVMPLDKYNPLSFHGK